MVSDPGLPLVPRSRVAGFSCHLTPRRGCGTTWVSARVPAQGARSVAFGRKVVDVARDLEISDQTIYSWLRQERIDRRLGPGLTTPERVKLAAARRRIAQLEAELAVHRRASDLLGKVVPPKGGTRPSR